MVWVWSQPLYSVAMAPTVVKNAAAPSTPTAAMGTSRRARPECRLVEGLPAAPSSCPLRVTVAVDMRARSVYH